MKVEYINPFIEAASYILQEMAGLETRRGKLAIKDEVSPAYDVGVILGVVGKAKGQVIYSMSSENATRLASQMMGGAEVGLMDDMVRSAIGELGNMVTGRAATILESLGLTLNISPPTVVSGQGLRVSTLRIKTLVVPLETDVGTIEINLGLAED